MLTASKGKTRGKASRVDLVAQQEEVGELYSSLKPTAARSLGERIGRPSVKFPCGPRDTIQNARRGKASGVASRVDLVAPIRADSEGSESLLNSHPPSAASQHTRVPGKPPPSPLPSPPSPLHVPGKGLSRESLHVPGRGPTLPENRKAPVLHAQYMGGAAEEGGVRGRNCFLKQCSLTHFQRCFGFVLPYESDALSSILPESGIRSCESEINCEPFKI